MSGRTFPRFTDRGIPRPALLERTSAGLAASRMVTLVGPPGVGKTRLAAELIAAADHAVAASVATAASVDDVVDALAAPLGLTRLGALTGDALLVAVAAALAERGPLLLVLDGAERCAAAVAHGALRWLAAAPGLCLVVTSRVRTGAPAESCVIVPPMGASDAVALLRARAGEDAGSDEALAAVARRLDGLPLALELAAARLATMPATELLAQLEQRALALGDAEREQGSLRLALADAWRALSPEEAAVLAQCAVFPGSFSLAALAAIVTVGRSDTWLPDLVHRLVDCSLLQSYEEPVLGERRFYLLGLVRAHAGDRLDVGGEAGRRSLERRHARHFAGRARAWDAGIGGPGDRATQVRLQCELDNLVQARDVAISTGDAPSALAIGVAIDSALMRQRLGSRRIDNFERMRAVLASHPQPAAGARLACGLALTRLAVSDLAGAAALVADARDGARRSGDPVLRAAAAHAEAMVLYFRGEPTASTAAVCAALSSLPIEQDEADGEAARVRGMLHQLRALLGHWAGGPGRAPVHHSELAVEAFERSGDRYGLAEAEEMRATILFDRGELAPARASLERVLAMRDGSGDGYARPVVLGTLGLVELECGDLEKACALLDTASQRCRAAGMRHTGALLLGFRGVALLDDGRHHEALEVLGDALRLLSSIDQAVAARSTWIMAHYARFAAALAGASCRRELPRGDEGASADAALREAMTIIATLTDAVEARDDARVATLRVEHAPGSGERRHGFERRHARRAIDHAARHLSRLRRRLVVDPSLVRVRLGSGVRIDLSARPVLRDVLACLVRAHRERPGQPVATGTLIRALWPEEGDSELGAGRVHAAIGRLRRLGLGQYLGSSRDGYWLEADLTTAA